MVVTDARHPSPDFLKALARPHRDRLAHCDRHPAVLQDDRPGSTEDQAVMRPLVGWLLGGRQVALVGLIAVEVFGCFRFSAGSQELVSSIRKEVQSSGLTMSDSSANKNDGWGYDGEN